MLFHVAFTFIDTSEEGIKRSLAVFAAWQPPDGLEFKGFYTTASGDGGYSIVEADSAETLTRGNAPFTPWMTFEITPILDVQKGAEIAREGIALRDSIG